MPMASRVPHPRTLAGSIALAGGAMSIIGAVAHTAAAEPEPVLRATMTCDRVAEPGRVRCSVEARTAPHRSLAWADVEVLEVPDFASPLKARIGHADATSQKDGQSTWAFALVARRVGQGEARVRVRAVTCERTADGGTANARCAPVTTEARAQVTVGG